MLYSSTACSHEESQVNKMKKKILFLTSTGIHSGGERVTLNIASAMNKRGYSVVYAGLAGPIKDFAQNANVPFYQMKRFTLSEAYRLIHLVRPDVVHAADFRASLISVILRQRTVAHLHHDASWLSGVNLYSLAMALIVKKSRRTICVSSSIVEQYCMSECFKENMMVLPNVVDLKEIRTCSEGFFGKEKKYDIVFLGRFSEEKAPVRFVHIVKQIREYINVRAVMVGDGVLRIQVEQEVEKNGLKENVTLLGNLSNPFPVLAQCRLLIVPSLREGFGLAAVEGMGLGIPVLASKVGGLKMIVTPACGALCNTEQEFADHAVKLLRDEALWNQKSVAAVEQAKHFGNINEYYDRIEKLYNE